MRFKLYVSFVFFVLLCTKGFAQKDTYEFSRLDITNGLSDNQVNCIFKDEKGFIWFGTTSGLNRYDGSKFKVFKRDNKNPVSLIENHVVRIEQGPDSKLWVFTHSNISIYNPQTESISNNITAEAAKYNVPTHHITHVRKDALGRFWFITDNAGIYCYNPTGRTTTFYSTFTGWTTKLHSNNVMDVVTTANNHVWLLYNDAIIEELDTKAKKISRRYDGFARAHNFRPLNYTLMLDNKQNIWISSDAAPFGVYSYDTRTNGLTHYSKDTPAARLNSNVVNSIVLADDNKIWLGTDHGGLNIIDPETNRVTYVMSKADDAKSLSGNSLYLYKDNTGIIWAGTFKQGVNYYHSGIIQFPLYKHYNNDPNSLPYGDINTFAEDDKNNLWIGTNSSGLIYYNRAANTFTSFKHNPADPNSIANDIIIKLHIDKQHKLWIGTYFGGLDCYDGKKFTHYRHNAKDSTSIGDDRIYTIMEDYKGELWMGTFAGGYNVFNRETNSFRHPKYPMYSEYTAIIYEDKDKNKWIGRDKGIDVIEYKTNKVRHYASDPANRNSLVGNDVNAITQDSRGLIWIGTKDGLSVLDAKANNFLNIDEGINLPGNNVSNIIEDKEGKMWVSTTNGLAKIELKLTGGKYKFRMNVYNELDGLQGRSFNLYSALRLKSGELVFGGINGFNIFYPNIANTFKPKPNLVFTDMRLFNKTVAVGENINGDAILIKALSETKEITLEHDQNVFDIEFAAGDFFNPEKTKFEYKLEGFDKDWITVAGNNRRATYTNLDGGDYVFKVRTQHAAVDDTIALNITVKPPFLKSPLAYFCYFIILMGALLYIRHRGILKLKREFDALQAKTEAERKIAREREEARRMHQLDLMKIKFFTNVSHEFRTPLSLILSPIDNLIKTTDKPDQQNQLVTIKRNGKRLLNLVNQLLDFRKMEYNELKLSLKKGDVIQFTKEVAASFKDVAQQKQIQFLIESDIQSYVTDFDQDKMERILFNLLSNAFKFTPSGGHISVMLSMAAVNEHKGEQNRLEIKVIDTGIGIPKENQEKIFERFFQDDMPESLLNQGSGIGLSITKEFVKMQGGTIDVESEPEYGSCFTISLPVGKQLEASEAPVLADEPAPELEPVVVKNTDNLPGSSKKPTILLVEDNDDLRFYLKDNLKNSFHIIEAVNGKDGWQKALAMHPKLIVSDISMPVMTGTELCRKIKADSRTAEIPVLLLTAMGTDEDQLTGLDSGANDYIVKPFNFEILLSKIQNALRMQSTFKKTYQKQVEVKAKDIVVVSEDDKFIRNAFEFIEQNITNLNFSVEALAAHLNLSRVSLYKKMLTLTGKTPVDCIRTIRLKRAVQLLEKSKLSIANVAYEVGFNNAAYFAKVFKEEYGILPSEYINNLKKNEKETELV